MPETVKNIPVFKNVIETASNFNINAYIDWFEKVNINTFFWQIIALIIIFYFGKEIRALLKGLIKKIPQIKTIAGVEFELSEETEKEIEENKQKLETEIQPYKIAIDQDPDMVFLTQFINFERDLMELYQIAFKMTDMGGMLTRTDKIIKKLIQGTHLDSSSLGIYYDIKEIRNKVAHGQKVFENFEEAKTYLQAVLLLKNMIGEGLKKVKKNEN
jgi:Sec-independent protein translocase protein TatA